MNAWNQSPEVVRRALWVEWTGPEPSERHLGHVRHPGLCWVATIDAPPRPAFRRQLQEAALGYLDALAAELPALQSAVVALQDPSSAFRWLPVSWGMGPVDDSASPDASVLVHRGVVDDWIDATLVLVAARCLHDDKPVGDGVGVRVVAHVGRDTGARTWTLSFAGVSASRLDQASRPLPPAFTQACNEQTVESTRRALARALEVEHVAVHGMLAEDGGDKVVLDGLAVRLQVDSSSQYERSPEASRPVLHRARVFAYSARFDPASQAVTVLRLEPMASYLHDLPFFERDPASLGPPGQIRRRRPQGSAQEIDPLRELVYPIPPGAQGKTRLALHDPRGRFLVTHDRRSLTGKPEAARSTGDKRRTAALPPLKAEQGATPLTVLPLRSDNLAAAQAYVRAYAWFDRFDAYRLDPGHYFRHAQLPLLLRPRARLRGAENGRVLNAEVRPYFEGTVPEGDLFANGGPSPYDENKRPQLQVRFGSADPVLRFGDQALGLAADPRWCWHEFGHVLNYASTGELEFAFAHSAGDALAAIAADPDSTLSSDPAMRGATFPWAFAPRRHDREARHGYCWCGTRSKASPFGHASLGHYRHGYFEEQLLSSSLFRLYLSLGGATGSLPAEGKPTDEAERRDLACRFSASDYCVYLIMRAISLLGSNRVVPARTADQFVAALIDADLGTGDWVVGASWPYRDHKDGQRALRRRGGRVHKVIRWAFERQGLYAAPDALPGATADGPGLPPPGDVYIADRRGGERGAYEPVPLRSGDQEAWHAAEDAIWRDPRGRVHVRVQRRDGGRVDGATMRLWVRTARRGARWRELADPLQSGPGVFSFDAAGDNGQPIWVLASTETPDDLSNLPTTGEVTLPGPADLVELVAHDNNIGLALLPG